ncbi:MAG: hypothetical protein EZS28_046517, partial [Streblomastix strix]
KNRPSAIQLLQHDVFKKAQGKFDLTRIPICHTEELGLIPNEKGSFISAQVGRQKTPQYSNIPMEQQLPYQDRQFLEQQKIQQTLGQNIQYIITDLNSSEIEINYKALEQLYEETIDYDDQQFFFIIQSNIVQHMIMATIRCLSKYYPNNDTPPQADINSSNSSNETQLNIGEIEQTLEKLQNLQIHFSYMITTFMDILQANRRWRIRAVEIASSPGLPELILKFLVSEREVRRKYLSVLEGRPIFENFGVRSEYLYALD